MRQFLDLLAPGRKHSHKSALARYRNAVGVRVLKSRSEGSSSDALQDAEGFWHISVANYELEMLQVGLALRSHHRTVPIRLIHADQHPFDHVFCLIVESLCFLIAATAGF